MRLNQTFTALLVASLYALGCKPTASGSENGNSSGSSTVDAPTMAAVTESNESNSMDAGAAVDSGMAANQAVSDVPNAVPVQLVMIRALAAGTTTDVLDTTHGLSVIHVLEAPPSGQGRERFASEHLCVGASAAAWTNVRRELQDFLQRAAQQDETVCEPSGDCTVTGMEYQPHMTVRFSGGADAGPLRIEGVEIVSRAALPEAWNNRADAYIQRSQTANRARRCPAR